MNTNQRRYLTIHESSSRDGCSQQLLAVSSSRIPRFSDGVQRSAFRVSRLESPSLSYSCPFAFIRGFLVSRRKSGPGWAGRRTAKRYQVTWRLFPLFCADHRRDSRIRFSTARFREAEPRSLLWPRRNASCPQAKSQRCQRASVA